MSADTDALHVCGWGRGGGKNPTCWHCQKPAAARPRQQLCRRGDPGKGKGVRHVGNLSWQQEGGSWRYLPRRRATVGGQGRPLRKGTVHVGR